jgi:hypothetical protein
MTDNNNSEEADKLKKERYERKKKVNREYQKDFRENFREDYNEYHRNHIKKWRKEHPNWRNEIKSKPKQGLCSEGEENKEEFNRKKYMHDYFQRPEVKEGRKEYCKEYMRAKREYDKITNPSISFKEWRKINRDASKNSDLNNLVNHIKEVKKYPSDFPVDEFNRRLDNLLMDAPSGVEEKVLQDLVYDILEREKPSTMERMVMVYNDPNWENAIDCLMNSREYFVEVIGGDKIYMHKKGEVQK